MTGFSLIHNGWFAKAVFATAAFALAPLDWTSTGIWTLCGLAIGYSVDEWASRGHLTLRQSAAGWHLVKQTREHNPWMVFCFAALGHLARVSGRVTPAHLKHAQQLMQDLRFDEAQRQRAKNWFNRGKLNGCPLAELAQICRAHGSAQFESFVLTNMRISVDLVADPSAKEVCNLTLTGLSMLLGVSASKPSNAPPPPQNNPHSPHAIARKALGVSAEAAPEEIKLAYRRLVARYHPDRVPANASSAERERAQQLMTEFNNAMETLEV